MKVGRISLTGVEEVAVDNAWIGDDEGEMLLELRLKGRGELEFELDSREAQRLPAEHRASIEFLGRGYGVRAAPLWMSRFRLKSNRPASRNTSRSSTSRPNLQAGDARILSARPTLAEGAGAAGVRAVARARLSARRDQAAAHLAGAVGTVDLEARDQNLSLYLPCCYVASRPDSQFADRHVAGQLAGGDPVQAAHAGIDKAPRAARLRLSISPCGNRSPHLGLAAYVGGSSVPPIMR